MAFTMANNLGLDPFPDPVGHFGAPWRPFWISRPLIGRNPECSDQKTYLAKVDGSAQKPRGTHLSRPRRPFSYRYCHLDQ